jgi:biotin-(acetyl-CoA carboxylase) ligase
MVELSKLLSKLLLAIENSQENLIEECENDILTLSKYYPENHKINKIVEYTKNNKTSKIAELYFKRCLYLVKENYEKVQEYEKLIEESNNY